MSARVDMPIDGSPRNNATVYRLMNSTHMQESGDTRNGAGENEERIRLLLVDDEVEFADSVARALGGRDFDVKTAQSGAIALELLEKEDFDVAVLDLKMPGMSGEDLFKEIRQRRANMPVIMLTGHGTVEQVSRFTMEGGHYYLNKPCDIDELAGVARQAVAASWRSWMRRLRRL